MNLPSPEIVLPPAPSLRRRLGVVEWALAHPALAVALVLTLLALPTLGLPLCARDYYHLERAHHYQLARFWVADTFTFDEYFWWPFDGYWGRYFRPVWMAAVVLIYRLGGLDPLGYRLFATAVLVAAVLVFSALVRRSGWSPRAQLVAVALFALHPSRAAFVLEPAATAMMDCLITLELIGALALFARWRAGARRSDRAALVALTVLALCTKELAVTLPLLLVAYDRIVCGPSPWRTLARRHAPFILPVLVYLPLYALLVARGNHLRPPYYLTLSTPSWALHMTEHAMLYAAHALVPGPFHPLADAELYARHPLFFGGYVAVAAAGYVGLWRLGGADRWARLGLAIAAITLLPVIPVILQLQEFSVPAAGIALIAGAAVEHAARARTRRLVGGGLIALWAGALVFAGAVSAAGAQESAAAYAALRRALPRPPAGARLYFIDSTELTLMGHSSAVRLLYGDDTLAAYHLSFDNHPLPPNPATPLGRALCRALARLMPSAFGVSHPRVVRRSPRAFTLVADEQPFFESDLGRFALQGRAPFTVGETMRWGDFTARVDAMRGAAPSEITFTFDGPLDDPRRRFSLWSGTTLVPLELD